jgi:beta-phosphoglucomutase
MDLSAAKGLIFDMDGTLVHNMHVHTQAWLAFFAALGMPVTEAELNEKNKGNLQEIMPRFFGYDKSPEQLYELGMQKEKVYRELYSGHVNEIEGLTLFLQRAQRRGMRLAMGTMANPLNIDVVVDPLGIRSYFTAIISGDDVTNGKPHPEVFIKATQALGLSAADVIIFEDSQPGITAAVATGSRVVGVIGEHSHTQLIQWGAHETIANYYTALQWL